MARKTDIRLRRSASAGNAPSTSDLNLGEVALNTTDGALFYKRNNSGTESVIVAADARTLTIDYTNQRIGILKSAPLDPLHVSGVIRTQMDGNNNKYIRLFGGNSGNFLDSYGNTLFIRPAGNTSLATTLDTSGNLTVSAGITSASISAGSDTDAIATLGRAKIGAFVTDYAYFSHIDNATSTNYALNQNNTGATSLNAKAGTSLGLKINNASALTVNSSSNIGIGTTSPGFRLDVQSASGDGIARFKDSDSSHDGIRIGGDTNGGYITNDSGFTSEAIYFQNSANVLRFFTNAAERIRIDDTGRLLINTTGSLDNNAQLHIKGYSSGHAGITMQDQDNTNGKTFFKQTGGTTEIQTQNNTAHGDFKVTGWNASAAAEFMRVVGATGKVGIGTSAPSNKLHVTSGTVNTAVARFTGANNDRGLVISTAVSGITNDSIINYDAVSTNSVGQHAFKTDGTERMRITQEGRIGIGTSSPAPQSGASGSLHIHGSSTNSELKFTNSTTGSAATDGIALVTAGNLFNINNREAGAITFGTSNTERMRIDSSGNLCLGNTGASAKLDIRMDTGFAFRAENGSGHYFRIAAGGATEVAGLITANAGLKAPDGQSISVGNSDDLKLRHATNGFIENYTNTLRIINYADDQDIKLEADDGSGGTTEYFMLDGSQAQSRFLKDAKWNDNIKAKFGTDEDIQIYHNGSTSNGNIENYTGSLYITNYTDDQDIIFRSDNGSGGVDTYFQLDGSQAQLKVHKNMVFFDSVSATFGTGADATILHDGSHFRLRAGTGNFNVQTNDFHITDASNTTVRFMVDHDGATSIRFNGSEKIATTSAGAAVTGNLTISGDLTVNGTNTILNTTTLDVEDKNITLNKGSGDTSGSANGAGITIQDAVDASNDATILWNASNDRFDFSHKINIPTLDSGTITTTGNLSMATDNATIFIGADLDLRLTHSGSAGTITNNTGDLTLDVAGNINLDADGSAIKFKDGGTSFGEIFKSSSNMILYSTISNGDMKFMGVDGGSNITALTLDMSVGGQLQAAPLGVTTPTYAFSNDSNTGMTRPTGDTLQFVTGGVARVRIASSGNVGIGAVTNPQSLLDISDGLSDTKYLRTHFPSATNYNAASANTEERVPVGLRFGWYSDYWQIGGARSGDGNIDGFIISDTGAERLVISNTGKVGIGTTAPSKKLHVEDSSAYQLQLDGGNNFWNVGAGWSGYYDGSFLIANNTGDKLVIASNGKVGIGTNSPSTMLEIAHGDTMLRLSDSDGTNQYSEFGANGGNATFVSRNNTSHGTYTFYSSNGSATTSRLSISAAGAIQFNGAYTFPTSDGNAGQVLKTNGSGVLSFADDTGGGGSSSSLVDADNDTKIQVEESSDEDVIRMDTGGTERVQVTSNGLNVVSSGGYRLAGTEFINASRQLINITNYTQTAGNASIEHASSPTFELKDTTNNVTFKAYAQNSNAFVGTTSSHNLMVGTNNTEAIRINNSQQVGIGTSSPLGKLHIVNNSVSNDALILETTEASSSAAPILAFKRNSSSPADADYLGQLKFKGENDADQEVVYAKMTAKILDASDGTEDGLLEFANRKAGSNVITARLRSDSLQLLNSTNLKIASDAGQLQFGSAGSMQMFHNSAQGKINNAVGNFFIDTAGDIILDAGGQNWFFDDDGTRVFSISQVSSDVYLGAEAQDKDLYFRGNDGGSTITALHLDMSESGKATFNNHVIGTSAFFQNVYITSSGENTTNRIDNDGSALYVTYSGSNRALEINNSTGAVTLKHGANTKLATTSTGVTVTGNIANASGDMTLDVAGDIALDADGGDVILKDGGTEYGRLSNVLGGLTLKSGSSAANAIIFSGTGDAIFGGDISASGNTLSTAEGRFTGKIGVGETSPAHLVEAKGTDAALVVHNNGNSRGGIVALASQLVGFTSTSVNDDLVFGHAANPIASSAFNEKMRIDNGTGNVSIGTSAGGAKKLDILDNGDVNGEIIQIKGNSNYGAVITYHRGGSYSWEAGIGGGSSQDANIPASYWGVGERSGSGRPARFLIAHTSGNVGIGVTPQTSGNVKLRVAGAVRIEEYQIDTSSTTTTATTQVAVHSFPIADFRTARFTIQIKNATDSTYHSTEIIAVHDGTTANITEFGEVHTGSSVEATFDADINSGNFRLLATPTSTNSMTFKVVCHSITV